VTRLHCASDWETKSKSKDSTIKCWRPTRVRPPVLDGRREAVVIDGLGASPGDLFIDQKFRLPDGRIVGWDVIQQIDPPPTKAPPEGEPETWPHESMVALIVPGERYRFVETREAAALAGASVVALAIAALAVNRRRPE